MKIHFVLISNGHPHTQILAPTVERLAYAAHDLGLQTSYAVDQFDESCWNLVVNYHWLRADAEIPWPKTIIYQLEHFTTAAIHARNLRRAARVWDYAPENQAELGKLDIPSIVVPLGYHEKMERALPDAEQPIDFLLPGGAHVRRKEMLERIDARLPDAKIMQVYGKFGKDFGALIRQSKVILDVAYYLPLVFNQVRAVVALNNQAMLLVEGGDPDEWPRPYDCGALTTYEHFPAACEIALERYKVVRARDAEEFRRHPMAEYLERAIEESRL